jgi:hypothetical protein
MKKLKIFWISRKSWSYAFFYWKCLMFPHLYENLPESVSSWWDYWWFWQSINENPDEF